MIDELLKQKMEQFIPDFSKFNYIFANVFFFIAFCFVSNNFLIYNQQTKFNVQFKQGRWHFDDASFGFLLFEHKLNEKNWNVLENENELKATYEDEQIKHEQIFDFKNKNLILKINGKQGFVLESEYEKLFFCDKTISNKIVENFFWLGFKNENNIFLFKKFDAAYKVDKKIHFFVNVDQELHIPVFFEKYNNLNINETRFERIYEIFKQNFMQRAIYKFYNIILQKKVNSFFAFFAVVLFVLILLGYALLKILYNVLLLYEIDKKQKKTEYSLENLYKKNNVLLTIDISHMFVMMVTFLISPIVPHLNVNDIKLSVMLFAFENAYTQFLMLFGAMFLFNKLIQKPGNFWQHLISPLISWYFFDFSYCFSFFVIYTIFSILILFYKMFFKVTVILDDRA